MEFTRAATGRLLLKNHSKWPSSGRQLPLIQWQSADPTCAISAPSGKPQPTTTQIRNWHSTKFALDLNTGNLTEVNKFAALIGHPAWKNNAYSIGSQQHCAAELAKVGTHLSGRDSGTDNGVARVNTTPAPLTTAAPPSCKLAIIVITISLKCPFIYICLCSFCYFFIFY